MKQYFYDLHIHSCLSPCGSEDMTPATICGIAKINGLHIVALTDHNSVDNCPAFFKAAQFYGLTPIAGCELTTAEDIHVVCLFRELQNAMDFGDFLRNHRMQIKNKPEIFGRQLVMNEDDEIIREEESLLLTASDIPIENVKSVISGFGGICYPAHIDREANGVIATLGTFPLDCGFDFFELHDPENYYIYNEKYNLQNLTPIFSSDAHYLEQISERKNFFEERVPVFEALGIRD